MIAYIATYTDSDYPRTIWAAGTSERSCRAELDRLVEHRQIESTEGMVVRRAMVAARRLADVNARTGWVPT